MSGGARARWPAKSYTHLQTLSNREGRPNFRTPALATWVAARPDSRHGLRLGYKDHGSKTLTLYHHVPTPELNGTLSAPPHKRARAPASQPTMVLGPYTSGGLRPISDGNLRAARVLDHTDGGLGEDTCSSLQGDQSKETVLNGRPHSGADLAKPRHRTCNFTLPARTEAVSACHMMGHWLNDGAMTRRRTNNYQRPGQTHAPHTSRYLAEHNAPHCARRPPCSSQ